MFLFLFFSFFSTKKFTLELYVPLEILIIFEHDVLCLISFGQQVDIPNIIKQRKQLAKLVLDYDSAKTR